MLDGVEIGLKNLEIEQKPSFKKDGKKFYLTKDFPQLKILDANYKAIRDEMLSILKYEHENSINQKESFFQPWIEKDLYEESRPDGWDIAPLMIGGELIEKNCKKAVFLHGLISEIKELQSASFSLLKPGTHIVAHKGYDEYSEKVLRYHLGLVVPKGDLGIRVEDETKTWKEGDSFIFDDFLIHEAWNFSNEDRYVLICDFTEKQEASEIADRNYNKSVEMFKDQEVKI